MQKDASTNVAGLRIVRRGGHPVFAARTDRDQRMMALACHILMAGIALERQVTTRVRAFSRS